jgi:hypothetical protein
LTFNQVVGRGCTRLWYLSPLAAAYAEVGDFERAVAEQKRALELLEERGFPPRIVASFEQHLASLEAGEPIREP